MNELGVVLIDYKRPQNMDEIVSAIYDQDISVDLYIVHIENDRVYQCKENIYIGCNRGAWIKHDILSIIGNKYVLTLDNDLKPRIYNIFSVMLDGVKALNARVGAYGLNFGKDKEHPYSSGQRIFHTAEPVKVDVLLGNFQMMNTSEVRKVWNSDLNLHHDIRQIDPLGGEDILLSFLYTKYGNGNFVVGTGQKCYMELDMAGGLEFRPSHKGVRDVISGFLYK